MISIKLSIPLAGRLTDLCTATGLDRAEIVRRALRRYHHSDAATQQVALTQYTPRATTSLGYVQHIKDMPDDLIGDLSPAQLRCILNWAITQAEHEHARRHPEPIRTIAQTKRRLDKLTKAPQAGGTRPPEPPVLASSGEAPPEAVTERNQD